MKRKPKFQVGQIVIVDRRYTGERFRAQLKKLIANGACGPCWELARLDSEYEQYMRPLKRAKR
jgi:hypothetical protein